MHEQAACEVVLAEAIETADTQHALLSEDDRRQATREAQDGMASLPANPAGPASAARQQEFLHRRAQILLRLLRERHNDFAVHAFGGGRPLVAVLSLLPLAALAAGFLLDRITDPHRVDLLSAPLLGILAWNLVLYLVLAARTLFARRRHDATPIGTTAWTRWVMAHTTPHWLANRPSHPSQWAGAMERFATRWQALGGPLTAARLARLLHLAAAAFAIGAVASLYLRGMLTQYMAGWESTFLDAPRVHALLDTLFAPATAVFPLRGFTLGEVAALHFEIAALPAAAAPAFAGALWVHLYAATIVLLVVAPRLLLAAWAHAQAWHRARNIPIDPRQPYFMRLLTAVGEPTGGLCVWPYSLSLDEARMQGLRRVASALLGSNAPLLLSPAIAYGDEPTAAWHDDAPPAEPKPALTAMLMSLAATPERENHGAWLTLFRQRMGERPWVVLIDASGFARTLGNTREGTGRARLGQRIALWEQFCAEREARCQVVDLLHPEHPLRDTGTPRPENVLSPSR